MKENITGEEMISEGKFLTLRKVFFTDSRGVSRCWESADRVNRAGAVLVVATIEPDDELILVRQFRPPTGKPVVEFPAGLIEPGEKPEKTALRELYEETGFTGKVTAITPPGYSSPGMSGEPITIAFVDVDGNFYRGKTVVAHPEETESIECLRVPLKELQNFIDSETRAGHGIDNKLFIYAAALKR